MRWDLSPLRLDAGIIPADVRMIFKEKNVVLSAGARVVDQYRCSWLVTDQGAAYYMEATPPVVAANGKPGKAGQLKISKADLELIYSDLTAVITGPNANRFALSNTSPTFRQIPALPDRRQPYREYTIIYHQALFAAQAFGAFRNSNLVNVIAAGGDNFAINYGSAAIGPEVVANRLGVGPMGNKDAVDLKFEEFFLSAWAVGDPAMVVDHPANAPNAIVGSPDEKRQLRTLVPDGSIAKQLADANNKPTPALVSPAGFDDFAPLKKTAATKAFYPDDPSNVYHSYMSDHVKFRILHAGSGPSHVHHLHAHQWLRSPDSDSSSYLDSQLLVPGTAFTLEITYNGSGNRNKTVGFDFPLPLLPALREGNVGALANSRRL
jgi:manganese oxidase